MGTIIDTWHGKVFILCVCFYFFGLVSGMIQFIYIAGIGFIIATIGLVREDNEMKRRLKNENM